MENAKNLADKIRLAREWRGIGKKEMADLAGVSPGSVTQWENGQTKGLKAENLFKLVEILNVPPAYFFKPTMTLEQAIALDDLDLPADVAIFAEIMASLPKPAREVFHIMLRASMKLAVYSKSMPDEVISGFSRIRTDGYNTTSDSDDLITGEITPKKIRQGVVENVRIVEGDKKEGS